MAENTDGAFRGPLARAFEAQSSAFPMDVASLLLSPAHALPVAPASDRSVWDAESGTADRVSIRDQLERAGADLGTAWPQPTASLAARVHRDGDRDLWEGRAFARQRRLSRAAVAAAVTLDERWIDEVADGAWLLCEQSSWCWPAHDDTRRRHGSVLATVTDPFLDLGAGEVVGQLAWLDQLLGSQLDERYPGLRARIRHEARLRVFDPFLVRRDWHWLGLDTPPHNWNPWIHGNVLAAALRLLDAPGEEQTRARIVALSVEGIDRYVAALPDDGAIDEGYAYWWNGACRALEALDILTHATDGRLDAIASIPALRETIAFPHRMHLGGDWYVNLADGQARPPADQPWHALHRAARRVGDTAALAHAATHRVAGDPVATEADGLGRLLRGLTDTDWIHAGPAESPLPRDVWLGSTEVMLARQHDGSTSGLTLVGKGGHNGENHNHNDVGSFIVASDGVPVLVDAGRPTYTAATFGPDRYSIWTMQSAWHSVPEIRGVGQGTGAAFAAAGTAYRATDADAVLELDLAGAYPADGIRSWHRIIRLERGPAGGRAVITDAWDLEGQAHDDEPATSVHLVVAGEVSLQKGAAVVTPLNGATPVRIGWPETVAAGRTVRELDDPMLTAVWGERLTRLELTVTGRDAIVVTVEPQPTQQPTPEEHR
jgi:hypothetical protein